MKQLVQVLPKGKIELIDVPDPIPKKGFLLVENLFSVISKGTEGSTVSTGKKSLLGKALSRPDLVNKVIDTAKQEGIASAIQKVRSKLDVYKPLGYSCCGKVITGVSSFEPGDIVACGGGEYAVHSEKIVVPPLLCAKVPPGINTEHAAFATLGAIALHGIHSANIEPGNTVAVIGLGLIGSLATAILSHTGTKVIGIDINKKARERAIKLGAYTACAPKDAVNILGRINPRGADAVLVCAATKSSNPVILAGEIARDRATVAVVGSVGMNIPRDLYYHKELKLIIPRSYGPGRYDPAYEEKGQDYPIGFVRWTEQRNIEAFLLFLSQGMDISPIITHTFPLSQSPSAYKLITSKREDVCGIIISYAHKGESKPTPRIEIASPTIAKRTAGSIGISVIGAGNFATSYLLPNLQKVGGIHFRGVANATPTTSLKKADKFGFQYATSDWKEITEDKDTQAIIIATRHNLHFPIVKQAILAGKDIFVEKPPCLTVEELKELATLLREHPNTIFQVGYNRRFSIHARKLKDVLSPPEQIVYRIDAGALPQDHWLLDPEVGGGRVIGEVCHFVDTTLFLTGYPIIKVGAIHANDPNSISIILKFQNGSVAAICYTTEGSKKPGKERIEAFGRGRSAAIDNWKILTMNGRHALKKQDKGYKGELIAWVSAIKTRKPAIFPEDILNGMMAIFASMKSARTGQFIYLEEEWEK